MASKNYKSLFIILVLLGSFSLLSAQVVINEYSASNLADFTDNYQKYEDWFELYNPGTSAVVLAGFYLSDDTANPTKWEIPAGIGIGAGQHMVFWASGRDEVSGLNMHTSFKLTQTKAKQEFIVLADPSGIIVASQKLEVKHPGHYYIPLLLQLRLTRHRTHL